MYLEHNFLQIVACVDCVETEFTQSLVQLVIDRVDSYFTDTYQQDILLVLCHKHM